MGGEEEDVVEGQCEGDVPIVHHGDSYHTRAACPGGRDADLVVWYPDEEFSVTPALLRHRHKVTPYAGRSLFGRVATTFLRGEPVFDRGAFPGPPAGRRLGPGPR